MCFIIFLDKSGCSQITSRYESKQLKNWGNAMVKMNKKMFLKNFEIFSIECTVLWVFKDLNKIIDFYMIFWTNLQTFWTIWAERYFQLRMISNFFSKFKENRTRNIFFGLVLKTVSDSESTHIFLPFLATIKCFYE